MYALHHYVSDGRYTRNTRYAVRDTLIQLSFCWPSLVQMNEYHPKILHTLMCVCVSGCFLLLFKFFGSYFFFIFFSLLSINLHGTKSKINVHLIDLQMQIRKNRTNDHICTTKSHRSQIHWEIL